MAASLDAGAESWLAEANTINHVVNDKLSSSKHQKSGTTCDETGKTQMQKAACKEGLGRSKGSPLQCAIGISYLIDRCSVTVAGVSGRKGNVLPTAPAGNSQKTGAKAPHQTCLEIGRWTVVEAAATARNLVTRHPNSQATQRDIVSRQETGARDGPRRHAASATTARLGRPSLPHRQLLRQGPLRRHYVNRT